MQSKYVATSMKITAGKEALGLFSGMAGAGAWGVIGFGVGDADGIFHRVAKLCQVM